MRQLCGLVSIFLLLIIAGCGGSGGSFRDANGAIVPSNAVTRASENSFTTDAKILAARVATTPWLDKAVTQGFDTDLAKMRAAYPALQNIHAFPDYTLTHLQITVKSTATWLANWRKGTVTTGNGAVDTLTSTFDVATVTPEVSLDGQESFLLTFNQSLVMSQVATQFKSVSTDIAYAQVDGLAGDGDRITFAQSGAVKTYTFSRGWGDCIAGCIDRHLWKVTIAADGTLAIAESGSDLSTYGTTP